MLFGEYFKNLREDRGFSQREIAELANVSNTEISRIEKNIRQKPSYTILKAVAPVFEISYEELMVKAGFLDEVVEYDNFNEYIFRDDDGSVVDIARKAKNIYDRDKDLFRTLDRAVIKSSDEGLDLVKSLLRSISTHDLDVQEINALKFVLDSIERKTRK